MMSVSFFMAYRSFWKFWQASTPATIRRLLKPRHPDSRIAPCRRGASFAYNVKELRQQEARIAEHAEKSYEQFVATWQPRPPKNSGGCAIASNRQGLNRLPGDASSRHATLRHEVDRTGEK